MLRPHAGRPQMPETVLVELIGDQGQDALPVMLRSERAIAVALAQVLEVVVEVTHGAPRVAWAWSFPFIQSALRVARSSVLRGAKGFGKCFCPSRAPQRSGNHKGRGTPLPFVQVALLLAGVARATGAAFVPVGTSHAGSIDPRSKGVLRTRHVDPLTGDRAALHWSGRCSALQVRFKTAPLASGSRPAEIEGLALDPLITSLRHCARHRC